MCIVDYLTEKRKRASTVNICPLVPMFHDDAFLVPTTWFAWIPVARFIWDTFRWTIGKFPSVIVAFEAVDRQPHFRNSSVFLPQKFLRFRTVDCRECASFWQTRGLCFSIVRSFGIVKVVIAIRPQKIFAEICENNWNGWIYISMQNDIEVNRES